MVSLVTVSDVTDWGWGIRQRGPRCGVKGEVLQGQLASLGGASAYCTGADCQVVQSHLLLPV